ncbi:MAG TPA: NAD(P)/FAD-dependent oxidoreductase [Polyangiales bacterium]|nr:NAD(P)/FAD-dependent oxidoreductase [Polyangiales bacterium]
MDEVDVVIIGAGAVGLACAATLAARGDGVLVIERHNRVGQETSSRNSGVIHAGLYYPTGSLKAKLCVEGRELLYARAARDNVDHKKCGKLVVAADEAERGRLEQLAAVAAQNDAGAVRLLTAAEARALEPRLNVTIALWSPETGIVDAHGLMDSYRLEAKRHGADLLMVAELVAIEPVNAGYDLVLEVGSQRERETVRARRVINAAGLGASRVAALAGLPVDELGYQQRLCKGDYFSVRSSATRGLSHLIYPLPVHAGLGVHLTLDLQGQVRAGPDTQYIDTANYDVDPDKRHAFGAAIRHYFPHVQDDDLEPDYAGLRPKLQGPGQAFRDFVIEESSAHGLPGFVQLLGIESPGLTASEAIARRVSSLLPS